jgi:Tfp pilus assembly protein PilZ
MTQQAKGAVMAESMNDVRKDKRRPVSVSIEFKNKKKRVAAVTGNLSTGGMFVSTKAPLNVSNILFFTLLSGNKVVHFNLEGEVVWNNGRGIRGFRRDLPAGMGIKFVDSRIISRPALKDFVDFIEESTFKICP